MIKCQLLRNTWWGGDFTIHSVSASWSAFTIVHLEGGRIYNSHLRGKDSQFTFDSVHASFPHEIYAPPPSPWEAWGCHKYGLITESKLKFTFSTVMDIDGHISSQQHSAHYTKWQHDFTVPKTILDDLWPHFLGSADGVYFEYGNAFSTVSFWWS